MRSSEFMKAMAGAVQQHLPPALPLRRGRAWSYGAQLYDDQPQFHYEVSRLPVRLGDRLELGLHFESRNPADNQALLDAFAGHLVEIKAALGNGMEAERWDKGWTKVYETVALQTYDAAYLDQVAQRMAEIVTVLHPIYRLVRER